MKRGENGGPRAGLAIQSALRPDGVKPDGPFWRESARTEG